MDVFGLLVYFINVIMKSQKVMYRKTGTCFFVYLILLMLIYLLTARGINLIILGIVTVEVSSKH